MRCIRYEEQNKETMQIKIEYQMNWKYRPPPRCRIPYFSQSLDKKKITKSKPFTQGGWIKKYL